MSFEISLLFCVCTKRKNLRYLYSSPGLEILSGDLYEDNQYLSLLKVQDNITVTNDNYFPIVIDTLNISLAISWVCCVQFEVRSSTKFR